MKFKETKLHNKISGFRKKPEILIWVRYVYLWYDNKSRRE